MGGDRHEVQVDEFRHLAVHEVDQRLAELLYLDLHAGRLERHGGIDQLVLEGADIGSGFGTQIDELDVARQLQAVLPGKDGQHLLARAAGRRCADALALERQNAILQALAVVGFVQRIADDDVVERPVRDVEDRHQVAALRGGGEDVLIAQHAEIGLAREHRLEGQRSALHECHVGLQAVLGEQVFAHGDVQRAGVVAVADIGDAYRLLCARAGSPCKGHTQRQHGQSQKSHCACSLSLRSIYRCKSFSCG